MNYYTLKFNSSDLEKNFQNMNQKVVLRFFQVVWKMLILIGILYFTSSFVQNYSWLIKIERMSVFIILVIAYYIIPRKCPHFAGSAIIIVTVIVSLVQISNDYLELLRRTPEECMKQILSIVLRGNAEMTVYITLLGLPSFIYNSLVLISILILKIIFSFIVSGFQTNQIQLSIAVFFCLYYKYTEEKQQRELFLLTLKETQFGKIYLIINQIDQYLKYTSDKPFLIVKYDHFKFLPKASSNLEEIIPFSQSYPLQEQMNLILRGVVFKRDNLENYLYHLVKNERKITQQEKIECIYNRFKFTLNIKILNQQILILVFQSKKDLKIKDLQERLRPLIILNQRLAKEINNIMQTERTFLKQLNNERFFRKRLKYLIISQTKILNLRFKYFETKRICVNSFNIVRYLERISLIFEKKIEVKYQHSIHDYQIITRKKLFLLMIFNLISSYEHLLINLSKIKKNGLDMYEFQCIGNKKQISSLIIYQNLEKIICQIGPNPLRNLKFSISKLYLNFQIFASFPQFLKMIEN